MALFAVALAGCGDDAPPPPEPPRLVRVVTVKPEPLAIGGEATGQIAARFSAEVGFQVGGRLVERSVDLGATVKKGDLLGRLDASDQKNQLAGAQAQVRAAQAEVDQATPEEQRFRTLLAQGFATQANYDRTLRALKTAQAKLQDAQAQLALATDQLGYTELRAANDGVVTQTLVDPGQVVAAGQPILVLAQPGQLDAVFSVADTRIGYAHTGLPVKVAVKSDPTKEVAGTVRELAPNADAVTRTYTVKVGLPADAPAEFRLGTIVIGKVEIGQGAATRLPSMALLQTGDKPAVWVVSPADSTVHKRPVQVLRYDTDGVLVKDGLAAGDIVVTAGVNVLAENQKVRLPAGTGK